MVSFNAMMQERQNKDQKAKKKTSLQKAFF
jgi:hypothetical protein